MLARVRRTPGARGRRERDDSTQRTEVRQDEIGNEVRGSRGKQCRGQAGRVSGEDVELPVTDVLVAATGYVRLDPIVALAVGVNIVVTGVRLLALSVAGLMDHAIPPAARAELDRVLEQFAQQRGVRFHAVRTREVGRDHVVSVHAVVPAGWSVEQGHALTLELERAVADRLPDTYLQSHVEPQGHACADEAAWADPCPPRHTCAAGPAAQGLSRLRDLGHW
jgi:hypothetical protein